MLVNAIMMWCEACDGDACDDHHGADCGVDHGDGDKDNVDDGKDKYHNEGNDDSDEDGDGAGDGDGDGAGFLCSKNGLQLCQVSWPGTCQITNHPSD